ncbi:succinyldiaminopimelate transaminase [Brachybacterium nesterenkovii]|uniref:Aminotransferase n=1 Tax=Brachybacterium nesterenkovii TaxID=47847 RepID=A0A1X6X9B6_9MICO|nr:succinyldiaminopimelate transaminase [Brachybacterium nesterenkovii]SLM95137.1 N-succinyl-L,L-diaminopimelate aminotransferase alternative [Brachybacterium nesterenkovii]
MARRVSLAGRLPAFPWDSLAPHRARAEQHPGGIVDLSVGTPVDPTPASVQQALADAADSHGYPTTIGTPALREALVRFVQRRLGAPADLGVESVLSTIGSKELVAHLPFQVGIGAGGAIAFPHIAYPTYEMGALFVGADPVPVDIERLADEGDAAFADAPGGTAAIDRIGLLWLNSPSNPTGAVLSVERMRSLVDWARERGIVVASDECYALLPWDVDAVTSILDPRVHGGDLTGLLCVYSLSKQSNLAGYRAAFVAGDPALVAELTAIRKQAGMMLPGPVQAAMATALDDDAAVDAQREIYRRRRDVLRPALEAAGGRIPRSEAGLYLWTAFGESSEASVARLADLGILCAPGMFYGGAGDGFVRIALTASDERIDAAAERLTRP